MRSVRAVDLRIASVRLDELYHRRRANASFSGKEIEPMH